MSSPGIRYTEECEDLLTAMRSLAVELQHEYILPGHMLFLMLENVNTLWLLEDLGVDPEQLRADLSDFFKNKVEQVSGARGLDSFSVARIIQNAALHLLSAQKKELDVFELLVALFTEESSHAVYFLRKQGIEQFDVVRAVSSGRYGADPSGHYDEDDETGIGENQKISERGTEKKNKSSILENCCVNLTELARTGKLDPIIGRKHELDSVMRTLSRKKKNNPLLVGEPGVGKTSIVEGLACLVAEGKVPAALKEIRIFSLDMGALLAGTKFRGEFEEKLKNLLTELKKIPEAILFIDEIHTVIGAGATGTGAMDAANILKPALNSGELRCIGSTTYEEYRTQILKDKAFSRRMQKIDVPEPNDDETLAILIGAALYYEKHYSIKYSENAIVRACELARRYINDRFMPDKAIDLIDEAGAKNSLLPSPAKEIKPADMDALIAEILHIPVTKLTENNLELLRFLEDNLRKNIIGQDSAISVLAKSIKISKAGIGHREKPIGSFLFAGPTGVGKTELARQLASELGIELIRFDMSEYSEEYTVSKLIGSAPGYVGFEQGGLLTEQILRKPHAVLLLDEIEKAHPKVYDVLLQVMDYGRMTDNSGRKADFRNIILIMSSNVGGASLGSKNISFTPISSDEERTDGAVKKRFTPEFRNRLDAVVHFSPLGMDAIKKIVEKFIRELNAELAGKNVKIDADEAVIAYLAESGFDEKLGARPLERKIRQEITERLADEILFGGLSGGGDVFASMKNGSIDLKIRKVKRKKHV